MAKLDDTTRERHKDRGATGLKIYVAWVDEAGQRAAGIMAQLAARPSHTRGPYEVIAASLRKRIQDGHLSPVT